MEERLLRTLRAIAWQRAKGELLSYLETYWPQYDDNGVRRDNGFDAAEKKIHKFISDFESGA